MKFPSQAMCKFCNLAFSLLPLCRAQVMALGTVTSLVAQHKPRCPPLTPKQLHTYHRIGSITTTIPYIEELINGFLPNSVTPNTCLYHNNWEGRDSCE